MINLHPSTGGGSTRTFLRHLLEMVLAMVAGMVILGGLVRIAALVLDHPGIYEHASVRAFIMTVNMTVGMSFWMRHRGHGAMQIAEMSAAMFVPLAILIYPFWAGVLTRGALMGGMHVLMIPAMVGVILCRRDVYMQDHRAHSTAHPAT